MEWTKERKNRLGGESSLYLRQHAQNPVHWFPWGDTPFEIAREENKPVLVSIGYAACHWCHVMEKESFEDPQVAAYMNAHFICIKVDREELPDVDRFYMDAVQALSGRGGWPLNVFVQADRQPFYGGTYYPPVPARNLPSWLQLLTSIHEIWHQRKEEVVHQAGQLTQLIQGAQQAETEKVAWETKSRWTATMIESLMRGADRIHGGFGGAPKFPSAIPLRLLIETAHFASDEDCWNQAALSLDRMIQGGIYDQIGGGFCRYATDAAWAVPHFEKMLYDNAQMVETLCLAYKRDPRPNWEQAIRETIDFVESELGASEGGYDSALDADSEGVEGRFYTWTTEEFRECLSQGPAWLEDYFGIEEGGNWEGTNILSSPLWPREFAARFNLSIEEVRTSLDWARGQLKARRHQRVRPARDDKRILSWNALWNRALTEAGAVLQEPSYLDRAQRHMDWLLSTFSTSGGWRRIQGREGLGVSANLGDYAALIHALFALATWRNKSRYLAQAEALIEWVRLRFWDNKNPFFLLVDKEDQRVPVEAIEREDLTLPSSNALMAHNLILAALVFSRSSYWDHAETMLNAMHQQAMRYPTSYGYWALLIQKHFHGWKKITMEGKGKETWHRQLTQGFWPQVYVEGVEGQALEAMPTIASREGMQVCEFGFCHPYSKDIDAIISQVVGE